jgi:hypothetical protein
MKSFAYLLIAITFFSCNDFAEDTANKRTKNHVVEKANVINNIEVAIKDFPKRMRWVEANSECEALGDGWRLPTKDELNLLYLNKDRIGGFSKGNYWSSTDTGKTVRGVLSDAWHQSFKNGEQVYNGKYDLKFSFRAVRDN